MKYLIVIEETETGFSAYCPDLDGCVATGKSLQEVETAMKEAIAIHIEGLREQGADPPGPHSFSTYIEVPA
jgi:predicted RNase H-like HicB family nuclease